MRKKTRKIPYLRAFYYLTDIKDATDLMRYDKKISNWVTFKGIKVDRLAVTLSEDGKMAVVKVVLFRDYDRRWQKLVQFFKNISETLDFTEERGYIK